MPEPLLEHAGRRCAVAVREHSRRCDGEVAKLKLMESDFGCWLETVCDWLYYLFVFAGMAIGLSKTLGSSEAIIWGSLLLFGP